MTLNTSIYMAEREACYRRPIVRTLTREELHNQVLNEKQPLIDRDEGIGNRE